MSEARTLPSGTVAFLFTDIEKSTQLWDRHGDAMRSALAEHDALLRRCIEARGGYVFKTVGDAFCAAFPTSEDALEAALEAQKGLAAAPWAVVAPEAGRLAVRMGIHVGAADERDGDYFGPPLNRTARLMSAGHGGQVLLSLAAQQLLRGRLPEGCALRDLGDYRLKDLRHSEHIFQIVATGLADITTPLHTAGRLHARERIVVEGDASARTLPEAMQALLEAVRAEDRVVNLRPEHMREIAGHRPGDVVEYRLSRVAEWSQPRYRVDAHFVALTLLVDEGEERQGGRWAAQPQPYDDLRGLLAAVPDPAVVLLAPPGGGKSTLLRRLELDLAIDGLREGAEAISFYVPLSQYVSGGAGKPLPPPAAWLAERWRARYPDLPPIEEYLNAGHALLLLDALNEMPSSDPADYRERMRLWQQFLQTTIADRPGNRAVFSCRSLDYSAPLSTPALRVPQVRLERLDDGQVQAFLRLYSPFRAAEIWARLAGSPQLDLYRTPYFLKLLVDQVEADGRVPEGRAALFTGFVRQSLAREIEQGNPLLLPDTLVAERDYRRIVQRAGWRSPFDLPERGILIPKLAALAYEMQARRRMTEASQVRVAVDTALDILDHARDEEILRAGTALSVLDEDLAADEVLFYHQLLQEYFAARPLANAPEPERVRVEWRADCVHPALAEALAQLPPADPLPGLPTTGWEETVVLAAAMSPDPTAVLAEIAEVNLPLAGQAAARLEIRERVAGPLLDRLRAGLVDRHREPRADLRARLAAGLALGELGDPRFDRRVGPDGSFLLPPLVQLPGGRYPIGTAEGFHADEAPAHHVDLSPFALGRFPVTNAEWACFMASGGYDDLRWWDTPAAQAWQRGETTADGPREVARVWTRHFRDHPDELEAMFRDGGLTRSWYERFVERLAMSEHAFEAHLREQYPGGRLVEPAYWRDDAFNNPAQPVVGISWYEARAFGNWLAAQSGRPFRLPTEVEFEAAARGREGRRYAHGDAHDLERGNTAETHLLRPSPVGMFPAGDSPEGLADLTGNAWAWTSSCYGTSEQSPDFPYPYRPDDGRENPTAPGNVHRVCRGGGWAAPAVDARASGRGGAPPGSRSPVNGLRVALNLDPGN